MEEDEWREVTHWSLALAGVLPELVEVLRKGPATGASRDSYLYFRLAESDDVLQHPAALADLMGHLLAAATYRFNSCEYAAAIVRRLLHHGASRPKLRALAERLSALGCDEARELADEIGGPQAG